MVAAPSGVSRTAEARPDGELPRLHERSLERGGARARSFTNGEYYAIAGWPARLNK
jgi:hypothetical protein